MKTGIFLRLYELNISDDKINIDFFHEHNSILKKIGTVAIGKAGKGFQALKIKELNSIIAQYSYIPLLLFNAKKKKLLLAKVVKIQEKLPQDSSTYPPYYKMLSQIETVFLASNIEELDIDFLNSVRLKTNKKNILDVIQSCRTSCMIVEITKGSV